jgi:hypothetical protein
MGQLNGHIADKAFDLCLLVCRVAENFYGLRRLQ